MENSSHFYSPTGDWPPQFVDKLRDEEKIMQTSYNDSRVECVAPSMKAVIYKYYLISVQIFDKLRTLNEKTLVET